MLQFYENRLGEKEGIEASNEDQEQWNNYETQQ